MYNFFNADGTKFVKTIVHSIDFCMKWVEIASFFNFRTYNLQYTSNINKQKK